jgi:hypothetical protein
MDLPPVGQELVVKLNLGGNRGQVKGISLVLRYDPSELDLLEVASSDALADAMSHFFFTGCNPEAGEVLVDLAALGTGQSIQGSGELVSLRFLVKCESGTKISFAEKTLRGTDNEPLAACSEDLLLGVASALPGVTRLIGVWPNPFAGKTAVRYELDQERRVSIEIYSARGRIVRKLVDGPVDAGRHIETWDGCDGQGRCVPCGLYFVKLNSGSHEHVKKTVKLD